MGIPEGEESIDFPKGLRIQERRRRRGRRAGAGDSWGSGEGGGRWQAGSWSRESRRGMVLFDRIRIVGVADCCEHVIAALDFGLFKRVFRCFTVLRGVLRLGGDRADRKYG